MAKGKEIAAPVAAPLPRRYRALERAFTPRHPGGQCEIVNAGEEITALRNPGPAFEPLSDDAPPSAAVPGAGAPRAGRLRGAAAVPVGATAGDVDGGVDTEGAPRASEGGPFGGDESET